MTQTQPKEEKDWKLALNARFFDGVPMEEMGTNQVDEEELQAFISSLLSTFTKAHQEEMEKVKAMKKSHLDDLKWTHTRHNGRSEYVLTEGYNQAIDDVLAAISHPPYNQEN